AGRAEDVDVSEAKLQRRTGHFLDRDRLDQVIARRIDDQRAVLPDMKCHVDEIGYAGVNEVDIDLVIGRLGRLGPDAETEEVDRVLVLVEQLELDRLAIVEVAVLDADVRIALVDRAWRGASEAG